MKKTITAIIAAAMLAIPAASSAQALIDTGTPSKVVQAGIRVGFNTSNLTTNYDEAFPEIAWNHTQWKQGFTIGAAVDINLKNYLAIQSGFYFKSRNSDFHYLLNETSLRAIDGHWGAYYFEIPLLLSFRLGVAELAQAQIDLGPYFATGFGGKVNYTLYQSESSLLDGSHSVVAYESKGDYFGDHGIANRFDWGLKFGLGFLVMQHYYIGAHYNFSCKNILKDVPDAAKRPKGHNKAWTFTLGYNF